MSNENSKTHSDKTEVKQPPAVDEQKVQDDDEAATRLAEAFAKALNEGVLKNHPTS